MAGYVDGFVMPLPKANVEKYREIATTAGGLWMEHGALDYKGVPRRRRAGGRGHLVSPAA
jgi:uncharacterized protein YbaA (DUF1428 family)